MDESIKWFLVGVILTSVLLRTSVVFSTGKKREKCTVCNSREHEIADKMYMGCDLWANVCSACVKISQRKEVIRKIATNPRFLKGSHLSILRGLTSNYYNQRKADPSMVGITTVIIGTFGSEEAYCRGEGGKPGFFCQLRFTDDGFRSFKAGTLEQAIEDAYAWVCLEYLRPVLQNNETSV